MELQSGLQLVIHHRSGAAEVCRGFAGLPTTSTALIVVEPVDSAAVAAAEALGKDIATAALSLGANVRETTPPCGGSNFDRCHAEREPECIKLRVLVADGSGNTPVSPSSLSPWSPRGPTFLELPVLVGSTPVGGSASVGGKHERDSMDVGRSGGFSGRVAPGGNHHRAQADVHQLHAC